MIPAMIQKIPQMYVCPAKPMKKLLLNVKYDPMIRTAVAHRICRKFNMGMQAPKESLEKSIFFQPGSRTSKNR